ncbi:MAG: hypothetical protein KDA53_15105 [Hyphomonas sp.]|nr:hypothetical protein [Hyphomonas sp.]
MRFRGLTAWGAVIACLLISSCSALTGETEVGDADEFSIFDLVTECDLLAAHPEDNQRMADGVADDEIVPRLAIMACEDSLAEDPEDPRFAFQLGRALLAAKREQEAMTHLNSAAANNYAAAEAYIGDVYQFGLGTTADPEKALEHYKKAVDGKFEPAKGQVKQIEFDRKLYISRSIGQFYDEEYGKIRESSDILLRNYLFNFTNSLMDECDPFLTPGNLVNFYLYRYPPGKFSLDQEEDINVAIQTELGEHDASIFVERHGCEGPVAKRMFANMNRFFGDT